MEHGNNAIAVEHIHILYRNTAARREALKLLAESIEINAINRPYSTMV